MRLVQHLVERLPDIQLISAVTSEEGLAIANNTKPDLIILDINLPGIDGNEVLKRLRAIEQTKDIAIIPAASYGLAVAAKLHQGLT